MTETTPTPAPTPTTAETPPAEPAVDDSPTTAPAPVEIDFTDPDKPAVSPVSDAAPAPAAPSAETPPAEPRVPTRQKVAAWKQRAMSAEQEAAYWRQQWQSENQRATVNDEAALTNYDLAVTLKLDAAKRDLIAATESGDAVKIADAQIKVAKAAAEQSGIENWKAAQPQRQQQPAPQPQPRQQQQAPQAETAAWLTENSWFNRNSPDYDANMAKMASAKADIVEAKLRATGRAAEIGGAEYFKEIDRFIRSEFKDYFADDEAPEPAAPPQLKKVAAHLSAPSATPAASSNGAARSPNRISLSSDQVSVAHSLQIAGPDGKQLSPREKEIAYARGLMQSQQRDQQRRASQR